ncbi:MAG: GMC family oxidoreductase N-terminal domain-containing protein [Pseudacidovorax sp.]|uniref:GMC family oxidoreductase n=2 Tax=unclassified Pseudacidovorax TaxID=2620592 RepID=UPI001B455C07|nr:GMC family oxidoreductase N-terminal domain-containing protein [Pseudacidovorax sp.]MBP6897728.1 GMC family oxidoreductase N-terminal domain-containing protein [Pseudacidovorax sp.]
MPQNNHQEEHFDYVIVGGGTAGCTLAGRLSEDPRVTVALLESGGSDASGWVTVPMGLIGTVPTRRMNWAFETEPQPGLGGRRGYQPRGRVLGGSSSINAMIYVRGHPSDYDEWAALGCTGWGWQDVLPYFLRGEGNTSLPASALHATDGPVKVSNIRSPAAFNERFLEAGVQCGYVLNPDFNGAQQEGVGWFQVTQNGGERWNAQRAYLAPARNRPNLRVITGAHALGLRMEGRRVNGVDVSVGGQRRSLTARAETLLCAGAFGSPQLLMLSGIGPAEALQAQGIAVRHALPGVGRNLQDHLDCVLSRRWFDLELFGRTPQGLVSLFRHWGRWRREREGCFSTNFNEAGAFLCSQPGLPRPDIGLHFSRAQVQDHGRRQMPGHGYGLHACVLRPASRGTVGLHSADPHAAPRIDPAFLSDPQDMAAMVEAYRICRRILAAPAFADVRGIPGRAEPDPADRMGVEAYIRATADTIYHPVGTCRMGQDAQAVTDPELRVHGLDGLRVVDASVMPRLIGGNTNAPTYMLAEKAVDLIRGRSAPPATLAPTPVAEAATLAAV